MPNIIIELAVAIIVASFAVGLAIAILRKFI